MQLIPVQAMLDVSCMRIVKNPHICFEVISLASMVVDRQQMLFVLSRGSLTDDAWPLAPDQVATSVACCTRNCFVLTLAVLMGCPDRL
eukprot:2603608-Amphidinium_carterae.1